MTCSIWCVENFVEEDGIVEGKTKPDGMCRLHLIFGDVQCWLIRLLGLAYNSCAQHFDHQLTGRIDWTTGTAYVRQVSCLTTFILSGRTKWQWWPAGDTLRAILCYWIKMKVVKQLTCLTQAVPMVRLFVRWAVEHTPAVQLHQV